MENGSMISLEKGKKLKQDANVTIKEIRKLNVPSCQRMKEKLYLINFGRLVGLKKSLPSKFCDYQTHS